MTKAKTIQIHVSVRMDESHGAILTLLRSTEQRTILLQRKVDFDEICTGEQLHNHSRGHDWCYTKFHECTTVGRKDDTHPIERVSRI